MLTLSLCAAAALALDVLFVDDTGATPGAFPTLQAALDASADGDTILIESTHDGVVHVPDRSLVVTATETGSARMDQLWVEALAAEHTLLLRNLVVGPFLPGTPNAFPGERAINLTGAAGALRLEGVQGLGWPGLPSSVHTSALNGGFGVAIGGCDDVVLKDCLFLGGTGGAVTSATQLQASGGGTGLVSESIHLVAFGTNVRGGLGGDVLDNTSGASQAGFGGRGASVLAFDALFEGGSILGGAGGDVDCSGGGACATPGDGGPGFTGATIKTRDTLVDGGVGGLGSNGATGNPGQDMERGSQITPLSAPATVVNASSPTTAGDNARVLLAAPGHAPLASLVISLDTARLPMPGLQGVLVAATPFIGNTLFALGAAPLEFEVATPALPVGLDAATLHLQGVFAFPGETALGSWASLTLVR
jgi:hypothetical protein